MPKAHKALLFFSGATAVTQGRREGGSTGLDTFCSAGSVPVRAVIHSCVTLPTAALRLEVFIPAPGAPAVLAGPRGGQEQSCRVLTGFWGGEGGGNSSCGFSNRCDKGQHVNVGSD